MDLAGLYGQRQAVKNLALLDTHLQVFDFK